MDALRTDPAVVARLAVRELGYERPELEIVDLDPPGMTIESVQSPPSRHAHWPAPPHAAPGSRIDDASAPPQPEPFAGVVTRLHRWLPDWPWRQLFCESPTRYVLLAMGIGLIVTAFVLYSNATSGGSASQPVLPSQGRSKRAR